MSLDLTAYQNEDCGELTCAPADEYVVSLIKMKKDEEGSAILYYGDDSDKPYMMMFLEVIDHPEMDNFEDFTHFIALPHDGMTGKERKKCMNNLVTIGQAFDIDFLSDEIEFEDIEDGKCSANVILVVKESEQYGKQNEVKQFLIER